MARKDNRDEVSRRRKYWAQEIASAKKRFNSFWDQGDRIVDEYRLQKGETDRSTDKYNILYSSTETIRPNLYAQQPSVRVRLRQKDRASATARDAVMLLNNNLQYVVEENDFDNLMDQCVEDVLLPGLGTAWVRYEPTFEPVMGDDGTPVLDEKGVPVETLLEEQVVFDYVYWKDILVGVSRGWATVPWLAKRVYVTKEEALKRFGGDKAQRLTYGQQERGSDNGTSDETAEVWEIWDKRTKTVIWYSESYAGDVLDMRPDPLGLRKFFPCPRPLRAISNTRTFVPRALYSQYKSQADQLNTLTRRIRLLTEALRVVGVYDGSQPSLADVLSPNAGNKMIGIDSWVQFAQTGGIKGSVEWLPIDAIVQTLMELLKAREIAKNEIYEITGFSDIVRGVSKASETLGAQNIKANWAGARVKRMQKEVQRFARDLIAIAGEILSEHCSDTTLALFGGVDLSQVDAANPDSVAQVQRFKAAVEMLRTEGRRTATVDIETDSTILADEEAERADRTAFLGAAGAFLQQAVPAMEQTPELGPLLGAMLMFVVRTFPTSRPIEEEFEKVQMAMANRQPKPQDGGAAAQAQARAQSAEKVATIRAGVDTQRAQLEDQRVRAEGEAKAEIDRAKIENDRIAEQNRHNERMAELGLRERELALREREVQVKEAELGIKQDAQDLDERIAAHDAHERTEERMAQAAEPGNEAID